MPYYLGVARKTALTLLTLITLTVYGSFAHARSGWEPITVAASGKGTAVCNNGPENFICFGLRCKAGEKPEFVIFFTGGLFKQPVQTKILIDSHPSYSLTFRPIKENGELGAIFRTEDFALLERLKNGSRMTLVMPHTSHPFSLRGSSKHIGQTEQICGLDKLTSAQDNSPNQSSGSKAVWKFRPSTRDFPVASASICTAENPNHCFGYKCNIHSPQVFTYVSVDDPAKPRIETQISYSIGNGKYTSQGFIVGEGFQGIIEYESEVDVSKSGEFLAALFTESSVRITSDLFSPLVFPLNGAAPAIGQILGHCATLQSNAVSTPVKKNQPQPNRESQKTEAKRVAAINKIVNSEIAAGCETSRGTLADEGLTFKDLDNDGKEDLILSHHAISCPRDHIKNSIFCGAQVCTTKIFLNRSTDFNYEIEFLGFVNKISQDTPPILSLVSHGGKTAKIRWNGKKIAVVK